MKEKHLLRCKQGKNLQVLCSLQIDANVADLDSGLIFEQDPVQIIDALLPLYLNSTLLRSLQVTFSYPKASVMLDRK